MKVLVQELVGLVGAVHNDRCELYLPSQFGRSKKASVLAIGMPTLMFV